ncbi:MAG: hypothetical protein CVU09_04125 [Bacteroidetes bacterium HGW-Bacteroidetes-4]|nr:MAG: hypothetical protein CVU09_04125 [Bacteroidetes bacterium HGW-Bacteroidetes-4]
MIIAIWLCTAYCWLLAESLDNKQKTANCPLICSYSLFVFHYSLFTIHFSLFTIHYSLFTFHYSLFTIH